MNLVTDEKVKDECVRNSALNTLTNKTALRRKIKRTNQVPDEILNDQELNQAINMLPKNYNFEIHKSVWRLRTESITTVALQFPEGLLMYSCIITDILKKFAYVKTFVLGDVTYGACCIDDFTAIKLGAEFLIHYGHSCIVPISTNKIKVLYVFVEIFFDPEHLIRTIQENFLPDIKMALMGTIQFVAIVHKVAAILKQERPGITVPQSKPLSAGETLGCTSAVLSGCDVLVFVADGRFHLEAAMIRNPNVKAYRYDPYSKVMTFESYDTARMKQARWTAICRAREAKVWGVILGTLGRQGSPDILLRVRRILSDAGKTVVPFLMAELVPAKLKAVAQVEAWVQVACPRLSVDWGDEFEKPVLTSYELEVAMGTSAWLDVYPMDYYSGDGGSWSNSGVARASSAV